MPFCEFWRADDAGVSVFAVLEVSCVVFYVVWVGEEERLWEPPASIGSTSCSIWRHVGLADFSRFGKRPVVGNEDIGLSVLRSMLTSV